MAQDRLHILPGPERMHMRLVNSVNRRNKRLRAGGEHQFIPGQLLARCGDGTARHIHRQHLFLAQHGDAVGLIPLKGMQRGIVSGFFPSEHRRKQDAVISHARLFADKRYREAGRCALQQLLHQPHRRHTVADNHQMRRHRPLLTPLSAAFHTENEGSSGATGDSAGHQPAAPGYVVVTTSRQAPRQR